MAKKSVRTRAKEISRPVVPTKKYTSRYTTGQFVGTQYKEGREKGTKNLRKLSDGSVVNEHGVVFSAEEKKKLESLVNSVNRKSKRTHEKITKEINDAVKAGRREELDSYGHSLFEISRRSKSLQRFETKEDYDKFIRSLERVADRRYLDWRTDVYRQNYITALRETVGGLGEDIVEHLENMSFKEYRAIVAGNEELEIGYLYGPDEINKMLNIIRNKLGLPLEDW